GARATRRASTCSATRRCWPIRRPRSAPCSPPAACRSIRPASSSTAPGAACAPPARPRSGNRCGGTPRAPPPTAACSIHCARRWEHKMPGMDHLLIVTTGGTIDKVYFDDKSDFQVGEPQIGRILDELGVAFRYEVIPILRKDSLHIGEADR